ncbi:DUF642 domain-containing protein [Glaciecola petra]|uniref:DUF642 domain-containing protein n=1 Tax=Glaciecola petra TaxID=3075602 RepID=A0ABU2ZVC7_9ALTE|nr:DUF642 domain-containing protein [Aestuariibacter sp. P117]MDT0595372.1 DUF642 domain-containing protein [Aestuariibacter sp. P117]
MRVSRKIAAVLALVLCSGFANANLIVNGGFESNSVNDNSWRWFLSDNVNSWSGSNIEIWDSLNGVHAYEGENHIELNAHPYTGNVFTILQSFATNIGSVYDFSFAYRARRNNNEAFRVDVLSGTDNVFTNLMDDHVTSSWSVYSNVFTATDTTTTLSFTSVMPATSTVGNFIDAVSVTGQTSPVQASAPASALMMVLGLALIGARRFSK